MNNKRQRLSVLILFVIIGLTTQFILLPWSKVTRAESTPAISWTTTKPTVFSSTPTESISQDFCDSSYSYQMKQVAGNGGGNYDDDYPVRICMTSGPKLKFGTHSTGRSESVVSFGFDTKMYPLYGVCGGFYSCLYIPQSDTMIARGTINYGSIAIYRNFSTYIRPVKSVHRQLTTTTIETDYYEFDASTVTPDATLPNFDGYSSVTNGAINASANGEWAAVELNQRGIGLINMQTLEIKRVSNMSLSDPTPIWSNMPSWAELTISNDGKHIAVAGKHFSLKSDYGNYFNLPPTIIDITPDCPEIITDTNMSTEGYPMAHPCRQVEINAPEVIPLGFLYTTKPRFDDAGGELGFYVVSSYAHIDSTYQIVMRASGYAKTQLDYLALGDSFSSGEGETDDSHYLNGTNDVYEKCHVSDRSYPFLIAPLSGINLTLMKSVACSGAKTTDIIGNDDISYSGQGNRLKDAGVSGSSVAVAKDQAKTLFIPGRIHQQKFVEEYKPKVITVGVGGNDAGLMDKLKTCAGSLDICEWAGTPRGKHATAVEINNLFNTLVETYTKLHQASPGTKIYVVGYPQVINSTDNCRLVYLLTGWLLDTPETKFMNESIKYLNQVVEAAAKKAGVKYINVEDSYGTQKNEDKEDQRLCGSKQPVAANEIAFGDDFNPIYDVLSNLTGNKYFGSNWVKFIGNESFHPNSTGHYLAAQAIILSLKGGNANNTIMNDPNYCPDNATICPDPTVTTPDTPTYWIPPVGYDSNGDPIPINTDYIDQLDSNPLSRSFSLDKGSLSPGSPINLEAHSDPISLGQFQAASDGSFNATITLPDNLEEGYHTIHLYGTSYSGEPVDIYQVINYEKTTTSPSTPSKITITNNTTAVATDNTNTTNITDTTKTQSVKTTTEATNNSEVNSATTSNTNDQTNSPIALVTPQTVKSDVSKDKVPVSVLVKGKDAKNTDKTGGMPVYVIIGVVGVGVVIGIVVAICLVKRLRRIKE